MKIDVFSEILYVKSQLFWLFFKKRFRIWPKAPDDPLVIDGTPAREPFNALSDENEMVLQKTRKTYGIWYDLAILRLQLCKFLSFSILKK